MCIRDKLFGDRLMIANATGCSSIYGGNLPTTPYCQNDEGRGPAWSNSLFEDNAEFGLGMRLAVDQQKTYSEGLVAKLAPVLGDDLVHAVLEADQSKEEGINAQRERIRAMRAKLATVDLSLIHIFFTFTFSVVSVSGQSTPVTSEQKSSCSSA